MSNMSVSPEGQSPLFNTLPTNGNEVPISQGVLSWLLDAKAEGATHVVVVCDTFDYTDYPVRVMPGQDVREIENENNDEDSCRQVMEVYWLDCDIETQLAMKRSFTYGPPPGVGE
jgi:hypothetical protein